MQRAAGRARQAVQCCCCAQPKHGPACRNPHMPCKGPQPPCSRVPAAGAAGEGRQDSGAAAGVVMRHSNVCRPCPTCSRPGRAVRVPGRVSGATCVRSTDLQAISSWPGLNPSVLASVTARCNALHTATKSLRGSTAGVARPVVMISSCSIACRIAAMATTTNCDCVRHERCCAVCTLVLPPHTAAAARYKCCTLMRATHVLRGEPAEEPGTLAEIRCVVNFN